MHKKVRLLCKIKTYRKIGSFFWKKLPSKMYGKIWYI
uniref:Uncharacterized protein n=1 Tax=Siphoviridae sp. ctGQT3 TaxID=2825412 RepID=A0A8S5UDY8_9CAUD|nr:MAG TPA: hypothetical protein [Siphoviridae sp. ctGQT3]